MPHGPAETSLREGKDVEKEKTAPVSDKKQVKLWIRRDLHRQLKMDAVNRETTVVALVSQAVEQFYAKRAR